MEAWFWVNWISLILCGSGAVYVMTSKRIKLGKNVTPLMICICLILCDAVSWIGYIIARFYK